MAEFAPQNSKKFPTWKIQGFSRVTFRRFMSGSRRFEWLWCLHPQGSSSTRRTAKLRDPLTERHGVTCQENWILRC